MGFDSGVLFQTIGKVKPKKGKTPSDKPVVLGPRGEDGGAGGSGMGATKKVDEGEHLEPEVSSALYEKFDIERQATNRAVEEQAKSNLMNVELETLRVEMTVLRENATGRLGERTWR